MNITGKAYAMTAFTPIKPWTGWINQLVMRYANTCVAPNEQSDLKKLSFIHFARWVIVPRDTFCRRWEGQRAEPLLYDYLFFESNFNGTWEQYIDAFSDVLPAGLNVIWYWSVRFPGSRPTNPFKKYIIHNQIWTDYFFNATPGATTNDVKAGLHFRKALANFRDAAKTLPPDEFKRAYEAFLASVQHDLGETGAGPQLALIGRRPVRV